MLTSASLVVIHERLNPGCSSRGTSSSLVISTLNNFGVMVIIVTHGTCNAGSSGQNRVAPPK